jgi:hypothetical protein
MSGTYWKEMPSTIVDAAEVRAGSVGGTEAKADFGEG